MKWQTIYKHRNGEWMILGTLMAFKVALQYVLIHPSFDLHRDEYLHLDQADHLAWGYISLPPVTSWFAWIIKMLGNDVFWVKFFPALFGAMTIFFVWKIIEELKGGLFAKVIASLAIIFSAILRLNTLFQPNSFEVMSWTALYYVIVLYLSREKTIYLILAAGILGIAFLNKYNVLFPMAGIGLAWLIFPERKILFTKYLIGAVILFLLIILPNILWQIRNDIPFIHHMKLLAKTQLKNMSRANFIKEQLLFFSNSIFLLVLAFIAFVKLDMLKRYRLIPVSFIITIAIYMWFNAKSYYSIGLYPVLIAFGAFYLEYITERRNRLWRTAAVVIVLLLTLPLLKIAFPYMSAEKMKENQEMYQKMGFLRWEDGKEHHLPQDFADMRGWRDLAYITDSAMNSLKERDQVLVITNNYGQAGAINYYSADDIHALSFNADYLDWFPIGKPIKHVIRVLTDEKDDDDPGRTQERSLCDTLILAGEVKDELAREKGTKVYIMKNVKGDVWPIILQEITEHKKWIRK